MKDEISPVFPYSNTLTLYISNLEGLSLVKSDELVVADIPWCVSVFLCSRILIAGTADIIVEG